ncbi:MAG: enterochelin esterase domain-containing protein [Rhodopirellula sp. JB055]|uniref:enterochelin esterase domain-containing protein n=1 Tax=Rhodopirellula sp. JB055 TaxID=3342846 RepID=UPI00370BF954
MIQRTKRLTFLAVALLTGWMGLASTPLCADEVPSVELMEGSVHRGVVASQKENSAARSILHVNANPGAFVRGAFRGEGLKLWLVDSRGERFRRLTNGDGAMATFMFVVGEHVPAKLQVFGATDQTYELRIDSIIPITEQFQPVDRIESPTLAALLVKLRDGGDTKDFWDSIARNGSPLVEDNDSEKTLRDDQALVTFLWRGAEHNVRIFGAPSGDHDEMQRLGGSDVWFRSYVVSRKARINYRLAPDVPVFEGSFRDRRRAILATAQRDPFNPKFEPSDPVDPFDGSSVVELPDAPVVPWLKPSRQTPAGTVETQTIQSEILQNQRDVHFYRPAGYEPNAAGNALLVVFDGDRYLDEVNLPTILDNLTTAKKIPSTAAVLVSNPSPKTRSVELPCNDDFVRFLTDELLPLVRDQSIDADRENTVLVGASYGGLASSYAALKASDVFGNVLSQSGSYWWSPGGEFGAVDSGEPNWLIREYVRADQKPVRFVLQAGTFETASRILPDNRHFRDCLRAKGYDVHYSEFVGGHGYFHWRYAIADGLIELLGNSPGKRLN